MRKLSLISLRYLCGVLLLAGSVQLTANEVESETAPVVAEPTEQTSSEETAANTTEDEPEDKYAPAGVRTLLPSQYLAIKTRLAKEDEKGVEEEAPAKSSGSEEVRQSIAGLVKGKAPVDLGASASISSIYITTHPGAYHFVYALGLWGETVQLEDGSVWTISAGDNYKVLNWLTSDSIVIMPNHAWFSSYGYCLVNQNTGVSVEATLNLFVTPPYHTVYNHRVVLIDDIRQMIWLEDGSVWSVLSYDYNPIHWQLNDTVIIGVNDGWYSGTNPNILINAVNLTSARAVCIQN